MDRPEPAEGPTHAEVFARPGAAFADPYPGCEGQLDLIGEDNPVLGEGGWGTHIQRLYQCRECRSRIGVLDRRVVWVERPILTTARTPAEPKPKTDEPESEPDGPKPRRPYYPQVPDPGTRSRDSLSLNAPSVVSVFEAIRELADAEGVCRVANPMIERTAKRGRRTVQYALAHLDAAGVIEITGPSHAKRGRRIVIRRDLAEALRAEAPRPDTRRRDAFGLFLPRRPGAVAMSGSG